MKRSIFKAVFFATLVAFSLATATAQDDDGIYGDIYRSPKVEEVVDSVSPLDGYSTVDDYYQDGRATSMQNSNQARTEQYVDESGNNITNNYYGDYYEDNNDYDYAARINRFHRPIYGSGYYDPFYTNMYYYNYDPFFWGTSIYIGYRPSYWFGWNNWGWNNGWGWNSGWGWNGGWGMNGGWGFPACYGGYGFGGNYWNGYNNGYWNGFSDGLAYGGYYNTFDQNSGIYYGPRGSAATSGSTTSTIGSGYRNTNFANIYNEAARSGKVNHANVGNVLSTADARPVKADPSRISTQTISANPGASRQTSTTARDANSNPRIGSESDRVRTESGSGRTGTRENPYQGADIRQTPSSTGRTVQPNVDRTRIYEPVKPQDQRTGTSRSNTYQRGSEPVRNYSGQPSRSGDVQNRGNVYQDLQRTQPGNNNYYRGNSNQNSFQQPSRSGNDSRSGSQFSNPSNGQRPNNVVTPERTQPSRSTQPSRVAPSRGATQPPRNVSPAPSPNRGSSNSGGFSTPSRSSGSMSGSGSRGGSSGSSGSRGGRP